MPSEAIRETQPQLSPAPEPPAPQRGSKIFGMVLRSTLPLVVLAAGGAVAVHFLDTAPAVKQRPPQLRAALVEVAPVAFTTERVRLEAMGTVVAARTVELRPRVGGEVVEMSSEFIPGGLLRAGDTALRVDRADYQLAVRQLEADVAQAEAELALERGNQSVARKEYELLGDILEEGDRDLVLRKPQLDAAGAALDRSRAALEIARLDLTRTAVRAPFNAIVQDREVDVGARVTASTTLATLVGTDAFWVEVAVPVDELRWIRIPERGSEPGSAVRVYDEAAWGRGAYRIGRVVRLEAGLEEQGRLARVLVEVNDPLGLETAEGGGGRLLLGSFVRVEIEGKELDSVAPLDRSLLRDGDSVWVLAADGRLDIRPVAVAYRGRETVLVSAGLAPGERLVTTDLPAPVDGMPLRTDANDAANRDRAPQPDAAGAPAAHQGRPNR